MYDLVELIVGRFFRLFRRNFRCNILIIEFERDFVCVNSLKSFIVVVIFCVLVG